MFLIQQHSHFYMQLEVEQVNPGKSQDAIQYWLCYIQHSEALGNEEQLCELLLLFPFIKNCAD